MLHQEFKVEKKVVEKRRHWSGFYAQVDVHTTQFLLNMRSGSSQNSLKDWGFLLFALNGGKEPMHHDRDIDHPLDFLHFAEFPQVLNTLNWKTCLCITNCIVLTESVAPRQVSAHLRAATCAKWTTPLTTQLSRLVRSFHSASFRVRFSIRAPKPLPHFIISCFTTRPSSFSESCSTPKLCKGASRSLQSFGKFLPLVSLDWFFAQALLDISLSLSWWSLMCSSLLTRAASLSCFSTIFLWSSTQTVESSRFNFTAPSCPSWINIKRTKVERERYIRRWWQAFTCGCPAGCLCHTQGNQSQETQYCCQILPKIISRRIILGWFWPINSDLQSCSKNTPTRDLLFQILVTILITAFTHFSWWRVLSSAIRSPWQNVGRKNDRKHENKNKEMTRVKSDFLPWKIEEQLKQRNQKKQLEKQKGC